MKIVQICPYPFPSLGGPARSYQHFYRIIHSEVIGMVRARHAAREKPVVPLKVTVPAFDPVGFGYYYYAPPARLREAEQLIAAADCVFIHGFFLYPEIWTMRTCRRHGVPYVIIPHGIFDPWAMRKNRLMKQTWMWLYGREVLRHAAMVLFATEKERAKAAWLPVRPPATVIKWAVEMPDPTAARARREELRRELGFAETDRVLLFFGRLHSMKCPRETVHLLAGFGLDHLKLLVVGPDGDVTQAQLQADADARHWTGLRIIGPVWDDKKYAYICAADGYISLSHRENFNYTLGETMAAGLPPILSAGNDLGLEFAQEGFAWQLKGESPGELRAAVEEFLHLPAAELHRRGEAAARWAREHLSLPRFDAEVAALMELVGGRRATIRRKRPAIPDKVLMTTPATETKSTGVIYRALFKGWRALPQPAREFIYGNRLLNGFKAGTRDLAAKFAGRDDIYNKDYYDLVDAMAARSVRPMTESMVRELAPKSVADVGCGTGALLAEFAAREVDGWGLEYSSAGLEFCRQRKLVVEKFDLTTGIPSSPRRFDLVVSMEVAEHVAAEFAGRLVDTLTRLADTAVFTAAVPGQGGGTEHVNEQPHDYWIGKFSERGFAFREAVSLRWREEWQAKGVEACYWRNVMVFTRCRQEGAKVS